MPKRKMGFATMSKEKHRKIASLGGRTAHEMGKAHQFTPEEAQRAGYLGGQARAKKKKELARGVR